MCCMISVEAFLYAQNTHIHIIFSSKILLLCRKCKVWRASDDAKFCKISICYKIYQILMRKCVMQCIAQKHMQWHNHLLRADCNFWINFEFVWNNVYSSRISTKRKHIQAWSMKYRYSFSSTHIPVMHTYAGSAFRAWISLNGLLPEFTMTIAVVSQFIQHFHLHHSNFKIC